MIVDPATGEIINYSSTQQDLETANSLVGQVGINAAANQGVESGALVNMMANIPSATTTTMWNTGRGSRTIMHGGFSGRNARGGRWSNHNPFRPRTWTRLSDASTLDNVGGYSPFDFMSKSADWATRRALGSKGGMAVAGRLERMGAMNGTARSAFLSSDASAIGNTRGEFFSSGTLSRMTAAQRIAGGKKFSENAAMDAINKLNPSFQMPQGPGANSADDIAHYLGASSRGVSQVASGYTFGATQGRMSADALGTIVKNESWGYLKGFNHAQTGILESLGGPKGLGGGFKFGAGENAGKLLDAADNIVGKSTQFKAFGRALTSGKFNQAGAWAARGLGTAGKFVPVVGQVLMAYDLTKMGMNAAFGLAETARDAGYSMRGQISKPIMGMGFKDNTVAATSRSRGVAAIQNSRLNARSALGSEGAQLAAHFG